LNLSNAMGVALGRSQALGTIIEDDPMPALSINDVAVTKGNAGTTPATFTVSLSNPSASPDSFYYDTTPGTASPGRDYTEVNSTFVSLAPGQTSSTITVNVLGDTIAEGNETFSVYLFSPSGATIARSTGVAKILDDDAGSGTTEVGSPVGGAVQDMTGSGTYGNVVTNTSYLPIQRYSQVYAKTPYDSRGILEFNVGTLSASAGTVNLWFYENSYTSGDQPVLIYGYTGAGAVTAADATSPGVLLAGYDPRAGLGWHSVSLDASQVASLTAGTGYLGLRFVASATTNTGVSLTYYVPALDFLPSAPVVPVVNVSDISVVEGTPNGGYYAAPPSTPATFTLTLSQAVTSPVAVTYTMGGGTALPGVASFADYQPVSGTVIFNPGETQKTITANVWQDTLVEQNETFNLQMTGVAGATLARSAATCTILNDDAPQLAIAPQSLQEGNDPHTGYVTVSLSAPTTQLVTAHYYTAAQSAQPGSDYNDVSGTVTFGAGQTTATVAVPILGDHVVDGNRTFTLNIDTATNATVGTPTQAGLVTGVCTIVDDDHFPVVVTSSDVSGNEGGPTTFDASASYDPDGNPMSFTWDFGDGGRATGSVATHAYADNGTYHAMLTVTTPYAIGTSFITVTVQNVVPTAVVTGPAAAVPGQSQVYTFSAQDPSTVDQAGNFTYQVD
jgi:chitinase